MKLWVLFFCKHQLPDVESEEEDDEDTEHGAAVEPGDDPPVTPVEVEAP